jgi:nitrogen fixation-related uncharacterized protein
MIMIMMIAGSLVVLLVFVGFNYWSASSQNQDLVMR